MLTFDASAPAGQTRFSASIDEYPMSNSSKITLTTSISLALSLNLTLLAGHAPAKKLEAQPLPHERELKDFGSAQSTIIPISGSRLNRKMDYREEERLKKEAAEEAARKLEEAKKQAVEDSKRAQAAAADGVKKQTQAAVDANNQAVALGKQGRWPEAIAAHEQALKLDPRNTQFRINLSAARTAYGQQRMAAHDYQAAAHLFRKALAVASDNGLAGKCLVDAMKKLGLNPSSPDVRMEVGDQLAAANDFEGAAIEYQAAMQLESSARTFVKMGDMSYRYGQYSAAANWYRQAIVKDPDHGPAHRQLGFLSLASRDYTAAAASLRKAVILDSKDAAAGQALIDIWRKQVAANPLLAENHLGMAGALQLTGDFAGADSEYRKLEALDPKNPGLESGRASLARAIQHARAEKHKLAAETLFGQGLRREALAEISQAVMQEPRNAKFQFLLGECLEANGDYKGAHQAYLTCVLLDPENNKEAAARMKLMQRNGTGNIGEMAGQQAQQIANQLANHYNRPAAAMGGAPAAAAPLQQGWTPAGAPQSVPSFAPNTAPQGLPGQSSHLMAPQNTTSPLMAPQAMAPRPAAPQSPAPQSAPDLPRKNMFEGGNGANSFAPVQGFRTHDESPAADGSPVNVTQFGAPEAPKQLAAPPAAANPGTASDATASMNEGMAKVTDLESQRDYAGAANLLRQMLQTNLQSAEVHHRLAVNLLAGGQVSEAVSEFRIASALSPGKKAYSDDLARALAIHKRSLDNSAQSSDVSKPASDAAVTDKSQSQQSSGFGSSSSLSATAGANR